MTEIFWGKTPIRGLAGGSSGALVQRAGETFYKISNFQAMEPFLMAVVSGFDHWMFVSSSGGLTCGRGNPEGALFPYYTDDKIHDAWSTTGPRTSILAERNGKTWLWKPFYPQVDVYQVERNLYKNLEGNKLVFEEINQDLGLKFSYSWSSSEKFGFVRKSTIANIGDGMCQLQVLDGLRNLLPCGIAPSLQAEMSTLIDAYKRVEAIPACCAAIYSLSSVLTDRAEPSEALKATIVWSLGLDNPELLLSEDQCAAFESGIPVRSEKTCEGKRGAFFVQSSFGLEQGHEKTWYLLSDVNQGPSQMVALLQQVGAGVAADSIEAGVAAGTRRLRQLVGSSDGFQRSSDALTTGRHFSNTLFNIMRGGVFHEAYQFPMEDFRRFTGTWNKPLLTRFDRIFESGQERQSRASVMSTAQGSDDADMERMALEYLPLTFSRRHGDPSRPWNQFSIDIKNPDGSEKLNYQGNWRDIFQNWEALALSYPEYIESFIAKFVNASTADGNNPYRITRDGFEWEVLNLEDPWSNIGYWGDHQINYLLKLLEMSHSYHPGRISAYLGRSIFVYADVPYRIKAYQALQTDPRNSVQYDQGRADIIAERVNELGSDGKLLASANGSIYRVTLLEKLLVTALSKLGSFVPGGGIWMNTQRPEWNDANNALVGFGLSMVTLCYLRRYLALIATILEQGGSSEFSVSIEVTGYLDGIHEVLRKYTRVMGSAIEPQDRTLIMDELGSLSEGYRELIYEGFSGVLSKIQTGDLVAFLDLAVAYLDHSITYSKRADGLFHSYNLISFDDERYNVEHLQEMLEGQVAVLSSGFLGASDSLQLLDALRASRMYRSDQNSYMLYPNRELPPFLDKNIIADADLQNSEWMKEQLRSGSQDFIEQDITGIIHFNGRFRNSHEFQTALEQEPGISPPEIASLVTVFEDVFSHRQFTGRSGAMYKYEGLGCIYWHMVSKLLLATTEVVAAANRGGADSTVVEGILSHFDHIQAGLGPHKPPTDYGAIPLDPYSHTTGFSGVQQPGLTGQVKEDLITRFAELGVFVEAGEVEFRPAILGKREFLEQPETWEYSLGDDDDCLTLDAGSLAFCLCGVPVVYRLAETAAIHIDSGSSEPELIPGSRLSKAWSASLFQRENRIRKLVIDLPQAELRH